MIQAFKLAYRNIGRNKTRSLLSSLAVGVGMALLLLMVSVLEGEMTGALQNTIRLQSGHLQIRPASYEENKISLKWEDLIEDPEQVAGKIKSLPQVTVATPRLSASAILTISNESKGVQILGIDPESEANKPFRDGMLSGEFIKADDREGILIGNILAEKLSLKVNDKVNLLVTTSNGDIMNNCLRSAASLQPGHLAMMKAQSSCRLPRHRPSPQLRIMPARFLYYCRTVKMLKPLRRHCSQII